MLEIAIRVSHAAMHIMGLGCKTPKTLALVGHFLDKWLLHYNVQ